MNKIISLALGALILMGGIFYFSNSNNEKENKVLVNNTKTETSPQKEEKEEKEEKNTKKIETLKTEVKKVEDNSRGKIIYKNTSENEGYNMELNIPAKWARLDYSRLGNPKEVELPKEEWAAGDELYLKNDPRYYNDGKKYFSAEAEKILLDIFQDRETLRYIIDDDEKADELFEKYFNDINKLIYVDEETGRKMFVKKGVFVEDASSCRDGSISGCKYNYDGPDIFDHLLLDVIGNDVLLGADNLYDWYQIAEGEIYQKQIIDEQEKNKVFTKWARRHKLLDSTLNKVDYFNYNYVKSDEESDSRKSEFCIEGKELDKDKCWDIIDKQLMNKYLNQK